MEEFFEPIEIDFELEYVDLIKAYREILYRNPFFIFLIIIIPLFGILNITLLVYDPIAYNFLVIINFFLTFFISLMILFGYRNAQDKEWQSSIHLPKRIHFRIDSSSIFYSREYIQLYIPWHYIMKFTETKTVYRIHLSLQSSFIIPKRFLKETDIIAINKLARSKLFNKAKLRI